jgi:hypothetical protein
LLSAQSNYQIIDQNHQNFIKELPGEVSKNHFGLFEQYISMKMAEWKIKHENSVVVAQSIDTNFSETILNAKRNAYIQHQLNQSYKVDGFIDVYTKVVEGSTSKLNLYESYSISWNVQPEYSSIQTIDFEVLPGGIVLFAFSLEKLVLMPTKTPIILNVFKNLIEKNDRQIPSYYFEINLEGSNWVNIHYINQFLQEKIVTAAKQWGALSDTNFLNVQNVSDWFQNNNDQKSERLTRLSGSFEFGKL